MNSESLREIESWKKIRPLVVTAKNHLIYLRVLCRMYSADTLTVIKESLEEDWIYDPQRLEDLKNIIQAMENEKYARAAEFDADLSPQAPALKVYECVDFIIDQAMKIGAKISNPKGFVYRLVFKDGDTERQMDQTSYFFVNDWKGGGVKRGDKFLMMRIPVRDPNPDDPKFATVYRWVFHAIRERQVPITPAEGVQVEEEPAY